MFFLLLGWWLFIYLFITYHWNRKEEEYSVKKNNFRLPLIHHSYFHLDQLLISCGSFPMWFKREVIVKKWGGRWRIRSGIILFIILTIIKKHMKKFHWEVYLYSSLGNLCSIPCCSLDLHLEVNLCHIIWGHVCHSK